MPNRVAIFIDGAYLDFVLKDEFQDARINYETLSNPNRPVEVALGA